MKKARIALAAAAILAVAGSTLAFKSAKTTSDLTLFVTDQAGQPANRQFDHAKITSPNVGEFLYTTTQQGDVPSNPEVWLTTDAE